ncbi:permease for cytosine/purines, uracil, thiamine, allantoin-domain-containing protein [Cladorrhinum sp. PSN259]|nr:permease for cytosine/purines, uracil, thiamine, allantoin-domain-containing protein [Cladorrhinum sp. PSN259]
MALDDSIKERTSGGDSGVETFVEAKTVETDTFWGKLQKFGGQHGVEEIGIERVPEDQRTDKTLFKLANIWFTANLSMPTFAFGSVAIPVFKLGFVDAALLIILVNAVCCIVPCIFATFGPKTGLRQIMLSRFFFGYHVIKILAVFQVIVCLGWASVNAIVGAQLFHAVNPNIPGWAGILIISFMALVVCFVGYKALHWYERWACVPSGIIYLIFLGVFVRSNKFDPLLPLKSGPSETASILSYTAGIFGYACGWSLFAADYGVYQPASRSPKKIFLYTYVGLYIPMVFLELFGAAVGTAIVTDEAYRIAYDESGIGGLLSQALVPELGGFGNFCIVILSLSIVAGNCPNIYSSAFAIQVLGKATQRVPRALWTLFGTVICVAVAIPGYSRFEVWLQNLVSITGYWVAGYCGIVFVEHFVFRRGFDGYRVADINNPKALPPGYAAFASFALGAVGVVLGMSQTWYVGPIAKLCGDNGDVAFELGLGLSSFSYLGLRAIERSHFRR